VAPTFSTVASQPQARVQAPQRERQRFGSWPPKPVKSEREQCNALGTSLGGGHRPAAVRWLPRAHRPTGDLWSRTPRNQLARPDYRSSPSHGRPPGHCRRRSSTLALPAGLEVLLRRLDASCRPARTVRSA
jgi:hypothetical protein